MTRPALPGRVRAELAHAGVDDADADDLREHADRAIDDRSARHRDGNGQRQRAELSGWLDDPGRALWASYPDCSVAWGPTPTLVS